MRMLRMLYVVCCMLAHHIGLERGKHNGGPMNPPFLQPHPRYTTTTTTTINDRHPVELQALPRQDSVEHAMHLRILGVVLDEFRMSSHSLQERVLPALWYPSFVKNHSACGRPTSVAFLYEELGGLYFHVDLGLRLPLWTVLDPTPQPLPPSPCPSTLARIMSVPF